MLIAPTIPFRPQRRASKDKTPVVPPGPVALQLTAASFNLGGTLALLVFDRAISIATLDPTQITVNDQHGSGAKWTGNTGVASLLGETTVILPMHAFAGADPTGLWVTATANTKIVAVNDGGTWAGVTQLVLPFPS